MSVLDTNAENTWCPGCGNFAILNAVKKSVEKLGQAGVDPRRIVMTAGIGQHAKIFDYLSLSGFYGLHGRSMATAQGISFANPHLKVIDFGGDGDTFGEGLEHIVFAAKRNADITVLVHDNGVYALTTGQTAPTSERGFVGPSTPRGSAEDPLRPIPLMLEAGASFVARGFAGHVEHLADLIVQAIQHEGFALLDVLQPCVTFNNNWKELREKIEIIDATPEKKEDALAMAKREDKIPIGVIWREEKAPFLRSAYGNWNPVADAQSKQERRERLGSVIEKDD